MNQTVKLSVSGIIVSCQECGQQNRLRFGKLGESFRCGKCQSSINPPGQPLDVTEDAAFFGVMADCVNPVLVDFWASWCGPCKMVAPEVDKFAAESQGKILGLKVNTESSPSLAGRFGITGIPTFILFKRGQPVARQSGGMSAQQLQRFANSVP